MYGLSKLYSVCDDITTSDTKLENKIEKNERYKGL